MDWDFWYAGHVGRTGKGGSKAAGFGAGSSLSMFDRECAAAAQAAQVPCAINTSTYDIHTHLFPQRLRSHTRSRIKLGRGGEVGAGAVHRRQPPRDSRWKLVVDPAPCHLVIPVARSVKHSTTFQFKTRRRVESEPRILDMTVE